MNRQFNEKLSPICEYLTEDKNKTDYILDLYYQRDIIEFEELSLLETQGSQAERVRTKLYAKEKEIESIKQYLTNFRDEKLKSETARFLQWINYNSDPPTMLLYKYPSDLKKCLSKIKRYDNDLQMMCEDINTRFKYLRA